MLIIYCMNKSSSKVIKIICYILLVIVCNSLFIQKVYSELTKQDIQEIRIIIREELRPIEVRIDSLDKRIDSFDKRIDGFDKRIDSLDKRIEDLKSVVFTGFTILFAGMFCMIGFVIWDRRTAIAPLSSKVRQIEENIEIQSLEIGKMEKLISALRELANIDNKVKDVLAKFNLL